MIIMISTVIDALIPQCQEAEAVIMVMVMILMIPPMIQAIPSPTPITSSGTTSPGVALVVFLSLLCDDGNSDDPNNPSDDSSNSTPNSNHIFRHNIPKDDLNNIPLAFEPFAQLADTIRNIT